MYQVKLMNKIAACGLEVLDDSYTCGEGIENPDAILVRSAALHDMEFPERLRAIARAGGKNRGGTRGKTRKGDNIQNVNK